MAASDPRAIVLIPRPIQLCNVAVFAFHLCSCLSNAWSVSGNFAAAESGRCDFETPLPDRNLHGHACDAQSGRFTTRLQISGKSDKNFEQFTPNGVHSHTIQEE